TPAAEGVTRLHIGWPLPVDGPLDPLAFELAAAALAGPDGAGRLPEALRAAGLPSEVTVDLPGLSCTESASYRRQPHAEIHVGPLPPERAGAALRLVTSELERLAAHGLDPTERAATAERVRAARATQA